LARTFQVALGILLGAVAALLVARSGWLSRSAAAPDAGTSAVATEPSKTLPAAAFWTDLPIESGADKHSLIAQLAQAAAAGVVNVHTSKTVTRESGPLSPFEMFPEFFGRPGGGRRGPPPKPQEFKVPSLGSGFVISADGFIVTNNHVVEGVDEIKVRFADGKIRDAKIVGTDPKTDLALIRVEGVSDLPALRLGDSDWILPGDFVVAIGNPFGLDHTVTFGIVSAKGRELGQSPYDDYLQIDAAINPGNSGGPLLDLNGAVVGINTAINPQANTIGFAVPINLAKDILPQLKERGSVTRGWLGVSIQEITPELAKAFKLDVKEGALVAQVTPGSPADKAGLQRGDVILGVDGKAIPKPRDLSRLIAGTPVGSTVKLDVLREGKKKSLSAVIEKLAGPSEAKEGGGAAPGGATALGLQIADLDDDLRQQFGLRDAKGAVVADVEPGSPAGDAGVRPGDLLVEIDRKPVANAADAEHLLSAGGESVLLLVRRGEGTLYLVVNKRG